MIDPGNPMRAVDLFVQCPIEFETFWKRAEAVDLGGISIRIAAIDDLIAMKRAAGRTHDLARIPHQAAHQSTEKKGFPRQRTIK